MNALLAAELYAYISYVAFGTQDYLMSTLQCHCTSTSGFPCTQSPTNLSAHITPQLCQKLHSQADT